MGDGEARPQRRPMAAIKDKKFLRVSVVKRVHDAAVQIFAGPGGPQPLAFNTEKGDFIEGVDHSQPRVEFQAVNDAHWIAEANMFGAQVAVPIDNVPRPHTLGQKLGPLESESGAA